MDYIKEFLIPKFQLYNGRPFKEYLFQFPIRRLNFKSISVALALIIFFQTFWLTSKRPPNDLLILKNEVYSEQIDSFIKRYKVDELVKMKLEDRCNLFFDNLLVDNKNWKLSDFSTDGYDSSAVSFEEYLNKYKNSHESENIDSKKMDELQNEFYEKYKKTSKVDKRVTDYISILRIFSKCFIDNKAVSTLSNIKDFWYSSGSNTIQDFCSDTEARVLPWLSNILPVYSRWDGTISMGVPNLSEAVMDDINSEFNVDSDYEDISDNIEDDLDLTIHDDTDINFVKRKESLRKRDNCFLKKFKNAINGRGYVISASDGQVGDLKKLALILRLLNNQIPIQIVHKGDLSPNKQEELINAFRSDINVHNLKDYFEEYEIPRSRAKLIKFPKQELWFVDIRHSVKSEFMGHFRGFSNKLLAYLFNSFEEMMMIDTDAVPFVDLSEAVFNFAQYKETDAFFFRDRELKLANEVDEVNYYKRLFPSKLDTHLFEIPQVTNFTLNNRFIGHNRYHFIETGVVGINRKKHFTGMLITFQLNFYGGINAGKIHGEKELFWLGLSIAGDENYSLSARTAASVGELTPNENKRYRDSDSEEICSNHPAHFNGETGEKTPSLMWINSGMTFCKLDRGENDSKNKLYKGRYTADELKKLYKSETKLRYAIIPPPEEIEAKNDLGNPVTGWVHETEYCGGYTRCAYNLIGDGSLPEYNGALVQFSPSEYHWFDLVGNMWMNGLPNVAYEQDNIS